MAQSHLDSDEEEEMKHTPTVQELQDIIRTLNTDIQKYNTTVTRLRASREIYRSNNKTLTKEVLDLKMRIETLTVKEEEAVSEPLDSDLDEIEQPIKLTASTTPKFLTKKSASTSAVLTTTGTNKKYPDVPNYYGDKAE